MVKKTFDIVGLRHSDVASHLDDFLGRVTGRAIVLMPEPDNMADSRAICAYVGVESVGYVSHSQLEEAWAVMTAQATGIVEGTVTGVNARRMTLEMETEVEGNIDMKSIYDVSLYEQWDYEGPEVRVAREQTKLSFCTRMLELKLPESGHWTAERRQQMLAILGVFMRLHRYDLSREMTLSRKRICDLLLAADDPELQAAGEELELESDYMGSREHAREMADYLLGELPLSADVQRVVSHARQYDADRVRASLERFPHRLFQEFIVDVPDFVSMVYYRHVPRRCLNRFVGGLQLLMGVGSGLPVAQPSSTTDQLIFDYTSRVSSLLSDDWTPERAAELWRRLVSLLRADMQNTRRQSFKLFNKKLVCALIGHLRSLGVYRQTARDVDITLLLEGSKTAGQRSYVCTGLPCLDDDLADRVRDALLKVELH